MALTLCVTGATGYVASHIVRQALEDGHTVHATVRDPTNQSKNAHILNLPGASERLKLFKGDLLQDRSFDEAVKGCDVVLHTASPFLLAGNVKDSRKDLVEPAVIGTNNVFASCSRSPSVKRVVVTSSVIACCGFPNERGIGHVFTEKDYNLSHSVDETPYGLSKLLGENAGWNFTRTQNQFDMVTINPGLVFGPTISGRNDSESVQFLQAYMNGKRLTGVPHMEIALVDVRDVAIAHLKAATIPSANGRHLCVAKSLSMWEIRNIMAKKFSKYPLPLMTVPTPLMYILAPILEGYSWAFVTGNCGVPHRYSNQRIKDELGMEFRDPEETLFDMAENLIAHGIVKRR